MATITIRNLDEKIKRALQVRAALNGHSMEAEARDFLSRLVVNGEAIPEREEDLGRAIQKRFAALGGDELQIPPRVLTGHDSGELTESVSERLEQGAGLGTAIHKLFAPLGGVELRIPTRRKSHRPIPTFE